MPTALSPVISTNSLFIHVKAPHRPLPLDNVQDLCNALHYLQQEDFDFDLIDWSFERPIVQSPSFQLITAVQECALHHMNHPFRNFQYISGWALSIHKVFSPKTLCLLCQDSWRAIPTDNSGVNRAVERELTWMVNHLPPFWWHLFSWLCGMALWWTFIIYLACLPQHFTLCIGVLVCITWSGLPKASQSYFCPIERNYLLSEVPLYLYGHPWCSTLLSARSVSCCCYAEV